MVFDAAPDSSAFFIVIAGVHGVAGVPGAFNDDDEVADDWVGDATSTGGGLGVSCIRGLNGELIFGVPKGRLFCENKLLLSIFRFPVLKKKMI